MTTDILISLIIGSALIAGAAVSLWQEQDSFAYAQWKLEQIPSLSSAAYQAITHFIIDHELPSPNSTVSAAYLLPCTIKLSASATTTHRNQIRSISFDVLVSDIPYALAVSGDCGGAPVTVSPSPDHELFHTLANTPTALDVHSGNIFIGTNSTTSPGLYRYAYATSTGTLASASTLTLPDGITDLDATSGHIYAALASSTAQLAVIKRNPDGTSQLAGTHALPGVSGSYPFGRSILYYYPYVFIGTHRTAGKEFHVFDITDPEDPTWSAALELNHNINSISVRWPYIFLASSGNTDDIIILDMSFSTAPRKVGAISFAGSEDTTTLHLSGNTLYAGRVRSTNPSTPEFYKLDITDIERPQIISATKLSLSVSSIYAADGTAFIAGNTQQGELIAIPADQPHTTTLLTKRMLEIDYEDGILYGILDDGTLLISKNRQ